MYRLCIKIIASIMAVFWLYRFTNHYSFYNLIINKQASIINVFGLSGDYGVARAGKCIARCLKKVRITMDSIKSKDIKSIEPKSPFDIFICNADSIAHVKNVIHHLNEKFMTDSFSRHYRIGVWHWETSSYPKSQGSIGRYYDELWVPTRYIATAIKNTPTFPNTTVIKVFPYGFEKELPFASASMKSSGRAKIASFYTATDQLWSSNLSKFKMKLLQHSKTVIFLIVLDFWSDYNRKNILGAYFAFSRAFPINGNDDVALVIKTSHHTDISVQDDARKVFKYFNQQNDSRIHFISTIVSNEDLYILKHGADCFLSLHKSEGWGFNLLESILTGLPVVATAFGGSEDFMIPLYKDLKELRVPAKVVKVDRIFAKSYSTEMYWGEPDLEFAATALRRVFERLDHYREVALNIRDTAIQMFHPEELGKYMENRLNVIFNCACIILKVSNPYWSERLRSFIDPCLIHRMKPIFEPAIQRLRLSYASCTRSGFLGMKVLNDDL